MRNLAANGLEVICYNFMPVVDWTRTDLRYPARRGGLALRFDPVEFAVYDLLVLRRANAQDTYAAEIIAKAEALYATMDEAAIERLESTIIAGLPGSELSHGREGIRASIAEYDGLTAADLRANLIAFLEKVAPAAEECGVRCLPSSRRSAIPDLRHAAGGLDAGRLCGAVRGGAVTGERDHALRRFAQFAA